MKREILVIAYRIRLQSVLSSTKSDKSSLRSVPASFQKSPLGKKEKLFP